MKVINLCCDDYANFMQSHHIALKSIGVDSHAYKTQPHVYKYPSQARVVKARYIESLRADVFIIWHSDTRLTQYINQSNRPKIVYVHTGTKFRQQPEKYKEETKGYTNIICLPEFNVHFKDAHYLVGTIDTSQIKPRIAQGNIIAHYPSNPETKGTEIIKKACHQVGATLISGGNLPYTDHIKRLSQCDIYIEMFNPTQNGKPYGSFGVTALEAAAMGKVVITNNTTGEQLYRDTYGNCQLVICNTLNELIETIKYYKDAETTQKGRATLEWFNKTHSPQATATRLQSIIQ